jgi:hypothetical protein
VPVRTFADSAGTVWEVFEVQRLSQKAQAVSIGLEHGWLAFVSGTQKRRLAPIPARWQESDDAELERLCGLARVARATGIIADAAPVPGGEDSAAPRTRVPRIRPARAARATPPSGQPPIATSATSADPVEDTVRTFAHEARGRRLPAIEAMVQLKALLARVYPDPGSPARNLRAVRRWFVEAYYFERGGEPPADTSDQSR